MKKIKIYIDSSVFGWSLNQSNPTWYTEANLLFKQIKEKKFTGAYSWLTEKEIIEAPKNIANKLLKQIRNHNLIKVPDKLKNESDKLAKKYCDKNIIPIEYFEDALHIAIATIWKADALVSFNFEHIVKLNTMININQINKNCRLKELFLCEPKEVIINDD
jgi:hypothetical protein